MQNTISLPVGNLTLVVEPHNVMGDDNMAIVYGVLKNNLRTTLCNVTFSHLGEDTASVVFRSTDNNLAVSIARDEDGDDTIEFFHGGYSRVIPLHSPDIEFSIKGIAQGIFTDASVPFMDETFRLVQGLMGSSAGIDDVFFGGSLRKAVSSLK